MCARRYSHSNSASILDKSACFMHKRIVTYVDRLLESHGRLDEETLETIHWLVGRRLVEEDLLPLVQVLDFGRGRRDREIEEEIHDSKSVSHFIERAFRKGTATDEAATVALIRDLLKKRLRQLHYSGESEIEKNLSRFQRMFGLTDLETELTLLFTILETYEEAESLFEYSLKIDRYAGRNNLKTILDCSGSELSHALNGRLTKVGILEAHSHRSTEVRIESQFVQLLLGSNESELETTFFKKISPDPIPLNAHAIEPEIIRHALKLLSPTTRTGCALLLFGPPGVGKTTLSYGLSKEAGLDILLSRHEGKGREWERRMAIMSSVYAASENSHSVVIIDDCDALIGTSHLWRLFGNYDDKRWIHELLETDAKMIFIANDTTHIEESVARRFTFSIAFKEFNRSQRVQLWKNILEQNEIRDAFTGRQIENLAVRFNSSPALIEQAVAQAALGDRHSGSSLSRSITLSLEAHERLLHVKPSRSDVKTFDKNFIIDYLNVSGANLTELLSELEKFNEYMNKTGSHENLSLSLLLRGPSGTGKSHMARYIAHRLDKELLVKRGSDFLNKYIGETEKRIRSAYEEAEAKDAILLIDEADSLLFNRDKAIRSWELSFTNEFLSAMEEFRGIQIFTTNRFEDLDSATLRRFSWKLKFDYLKPEGKLVFYETILAPLVNSPLKKKLEQKLKRIPDLAPGDYKAVKIRFQFKSRDQISHQALLEALNDESKAKRDHNGSKAIGF